LQCGNDNATANTTSYKMALFVASSCGIVGDTIINRIAWSHVDQLAAMSASIVDDQDRETNQIIFTNNEVRHYLPISSLSRSVSLSHSLDNY
jgi:hypothetical protein